jgi:hypothetical protein
MSTKLAILAALAAAALAPAAALADGSNAGTETVKAGPVSATLSWDAAEDDLANVRLSISRAGAVLFDRAIPKVCSQACDPSVPDTDNFQLVDLDGDGEPEVVVNAETGDCCDEMIGIYGFNATTGTYTELAKNLGDSLVDIDDTDNNGTIEIVGNDQRFENLVPGHTSYFFPPVVYAYEHPASGPQLVDRTRKSPIVVKASAELLKFGLDDLKDADASSKKIYVGSYVADEYMLGRGQVGMKEFDRQAKRGTLGNAKSVKKFRKRLLRLLHQYGYR